MEQVHSSRNTDEITLIGFPRVEKYIQENGNSKLAYVEYVRANIIDMHDPDVPQYVKDNIETIIDVSDPNNNMISTTIKPNHERAEQQRKLRSKIIEQEKLDGTYNTRVDKNVLIIYIDNVSRSHFFRRMPKTIAFLEQFYSNEDSEFDIAQFFRYHSSYFNTLRSNNALFYGQNEFITDPETSVFDAFAQNGYMTGYFKDA